MVYIVNFNVSRDFTEFHDYYENEAGTNINFILEDFKTGKTNWSVSKESMPGDIVVFMCAKEARHNLGMAVSHIPGGYDDNFMDFIDDQKALYKKYSGHLLGYGIVKDRPVLSGKWWLADIEKLYQFENPVFIDEYRNFITISRTNSITCITDDQWDLLKKVINKLNPGVFKDISADMDSLQKEFDDDVKTAMAKPLDQLKKEAKKKSS